MSVNELLNSQDPAKGITIEATVVTGFEQEAVSECKDKFGENVNICKSRGRVCFNTVLDKYTEVRNLHSVDNLFLITGSFENLSFGGDSENKNNDLNIIKKLVDSINWQKHVNSWSHITSYNGVLFPTYEQYVNEKRKMGSCNESSEPIATNVSSADNEKSGGCGRLLRYRVTCHRVGSHSFSSQEAATSFGGTLQDYYNWVVDLDNYDLEIVLKIVDSSAIVLLAVTEKSLHRRNITYFGLTTLRATVSYNMLKLANLTAGDVVVDPLCGSGSISIEGALAFPDTFHICGDIHKKSVLKTKGNVFELSKKHGHSMPVDVFHWDASMLPLNDESVDAIVTDLPFGKRLRSKYKNRELYCSILKELSRVVKSDTGRGVFLTTERNTFTGVVNKNGHWKQLKILRINMGGLKAYVFLLQRIGRLIK